MKKTLILALAATGLTVGGVAVAQDRPERGGDMTREQAETRAANSFARMDANGDGVLNAADGEARQRARFDRVDTDGNGSLSFEEFSAIRENMAERRGQRGERMAQRGERRGDHARRGEGRRGDRMAMRGRRGGHGGPDLAALLRQNADTDGDGAISQAEYTAAALTRFQRQDADGDGTATAAERREHREAMREVREAHRAQNQSQNGE